MAKLVSSLLEGIWYLIGPLRKALLALLVGVGIYLWIEHFPKLKLPQWHFKIPEFTLPDWKLPDWEVPDFVVPDLVVPDFVLPEPDLCIPDGLTASGLDKPLTIESEKNLVESRFVSQDTLHLHTEFGDLGFRKPELDSVLSDYHAEKIIWWISPTGMEVLMDDGRNDLMKFFRSSKPILTKIVNHFHLNQWTKAQKIDRILTFVQMKSDRMQYKRDAHPDATNDQQESSCREYMRKPGVSLVNGLQYGGSQWDCEDFSTNFIALCKSAGIPEENLCFITWPGHAFVGVTWIYWLKIDNAAYYLTPDGQIVVPIEPTRPAEYTVTYKMFGKNDTTYYRWSSVGWPMNIDGEKVTIRTKKYPQGFVAHKNVDTDGSVRKSLSVDNQLQLSQRLITNARSFLGRKYDSVFKEDSMYDWWSPYDNATKKYFVSYKSGRSALVDEQPLVCIDLIVEALKNISPALLHYSNTDPSYLRKVANFEKEVVVDPNFLVERYTSSSVVNIWDIITTISSTWSRHIGIVTSVNAQGKPMTIIHSSYSAEWVIENSYEDFIKQWEYSPVFKVSLMHIPTNT